MEKEELIAMINSTINTNGSGTITGESLNLALNAIVETMGTGGGAVWEKISGTVDLTNPGSTTVTTTEEDKAANIALIERSKQNMKNGIPVMVYIVGYNEEQNVYTCPSGNLVITPETISAYALPFIIILAEDGSVTIQAG